MNHNSNSRLSCTSKSIVELSDHCEAHCFRGVEPVTVMITREVAEEFTQSYGFRLTSCRKLIMFDVECVRNNHLFEDGKNPYSMPNYIVGRVQSIGQIAVEKKDLPYQF